MVLIVKKDEGKRKDIILVPKKVLNGMLERHVDRIGLVTSRNNTCIVASGKNWTEKPSHQKAIKMLIETLQRNRIEDGEHRYLIPHHLFGNLKVRNYRTAKMPVSDTADGSFKINFVRIRGGSRKTLATLQLYERIGHFERKNIENLFAKFFSNAPNEFVFLAQHLHPVEA